MATALSWALSDTDCSMILEFATNRITRTIQRNYQSPFVRCGLEEALRYMTPSTSPCPKNLRAKPGGGLSSSSVMETITRAVSRSMQFPNLGDGVIDFHFNRELADFRSGG